ncbi:dihydrolipoyl dehydrogenase [Desulfurispira natronophila]|uniref:Dihydrolipoamide dehydrogenase n=1 Tax=Desulfurispira natronophila TaxID=682562 RepID=A0A7W7Y4K5_9BACT|nr:dihydrolipoyl dehydrogenase [Desulfurispira natronophila]MBB5021819.1 dihydrolipoamide dehydrogenase [Desulfurispira natronophila]
MRQVDVAIIGAGSTGLTAFSEVSRTTENVVIIEQGVGGTTCARVGCMPSKVMIQIAEDLHRGEYLATEGIRGGENLRLDMSQAMTHVRQLRDRFVRAVMGGTVTKAGDRYLKGRARFLEPGVLDVDGQTIRADKVIIATGSRPIVPPELESLPVPVYTSDTIFEQDHFPASMAVLGVGVIGLELGQALARMGVQVTAFGRSGRIAGITDSDLNDYAVKQFRHEMEVHFDPNIRIEAVPNERKARLHWKDQTLEVGAILAAQGRTPNVEDLGLEKIGVPLDEKGIPQFDPQTMQVGDLPIFIGGDVTGDLPVLHEASDEGRIAGYNAVNPVRPFQRKTPLAVVFTDPNIAQVGQSYRQLEGQGTSFAIGEVSFEGQGRSLVMGRNRGLLRVYGEASSGKLLGAELMGPGGEHMAHELAWAIQLNLSVFDMLKLPFYHPVVEEGLRTALRDLAYKIDREQARWELDFA